MSNTVTSTTAVPTISLPCNKPVASSVSTFAVSGVSPVSVTTLSMRYMTLLTVAGVGIAATGTVSSHLTYTSRYVNYRYDLW